MQTNDNLSVSESIKLTIVSRISVSDNINTAQFVAPDASEQSFGGFGGYYFGQSNFANGSNLVRQENESIQLLIPILFIEASHTLNVGESAFIVIPIADTFTIIIIESVQITESVQMLTLSFIDVVENVLILDVPLVDAELFILISESIGIVDTPLVEVEMYLLVSTQIQVDENLILQIDIAINVVDTVSINEDTSLSAGYYPRMALLGVG